VSNRVSGDAVQLVFDPKRLRPAGERVQVEYGCSSFHLRIFNPATWLNEANDDMVIINEPLSWWNRIAEAVNRRSYRDN